MAVSDAFLAARRAEIEADPALATFRAALALVGVASQTLLGARWHDCYGDAQAGLSPAYRLRKVIRDCVTAASGSTVSPSDREAAIGTLVAEYVPTVRKPRSTADRKAALSDLLLEDHVS